MKVGIIGAGFVGMNFGKALIKAGHEVMFSSRSPQGTHAHQLRQETGAAVELPETVLRFSRIKALALPPDAAIEVAKTFAGQWGDSVLIDMNNRLSQTGLSLTQELADITGAQVVKAFNTIGAEHYLNPQFGNQTASMLIAGDPMAKQIASELATAIGFEVIDAGGLDAAVLLENLARLWVTLARSQHGRDIAFKLLRRSDGR
jgi:predicted dinucleotide-binding enzyme